MDGDIFYLEILALVVPVALHGVREEAELGRALVRVIVLRRRRMVQRQQQQVE